MMKKLLAASLLALAPALMAESINPPTKVQTSPAMSAQEKKNLDMVLTWWREVIQGGHMELSPKYQAETYIQHNPNIATGRQAFVDYFTNVVKVTKKDPIPATLTNPPVLSMAKGDFVALIWERETKDPRNPANTYHFNTFDILRIENGKVAEHWDSPQRAKLPPGAPPMNFVQPPSTYSKGNMGKTSDEEKKAIALATEELKDMLQYGHLELADKTMDPGYIQHNPNVPQGRDGFKKFMAARPGRTPQPIKAEWVSAPALTLASGPYVWMQWDRKSKDPNDESKEYVWNHFDVVRIENGLIKEHWDEAVIAAPAPGAGKQ
jgi:predicted SnoaL-like aldol condensation-catalyzing enzyme